MLRKEHRLHTAVAFVFVLLYININDSLAFYNTSEIIASIRSDYGGVGLVAWSVDESASLCALGFDGEGIKDSGERLIVTADSRHHVGSITKGMTATLLAVLIREGLIASWDDTLGSVLPLAKDTVYANVTLRQLTAMRAGIRRNAPSWSKYHYMDVDIRIQREEAAKDALASNPVSTPGTNFHYSNWAYVLAGHILEYLTSTTWEDLLATKLFAPLGVDLGSDPSDYTGPADYPWGHGSAGQVPCDPNAYGTWGCDNRAVFGPAGTFSGSVTAMATYFAWHVRCHNGNEDGAMLLSTDECRELHTGVPVGSSDLPTYGFGWYCYERSWAGGKACMHIGTNTINYYIVWLALGEEEHISRAYVGFTNQYGTGNEFLMTDTAVWETIEARNQGTCTKDGFPLPAPTLAPSLAPSSAPSASPAPTLTPISVSDPTPTPTPVPTEFSMSFSFDLPDAMDFSEFGGSVRKLKSKRRAEGRADGSNS